MIRGTLQQIADWADGTLVAPATASYPLQGVGTDTRVDLRGRLFVALKGENFDAHAFLEQAVEQGAAAALVETPRNDVDLPQIVVTDSRTALARLARAWRDRVDPVVIAITGSSGKTTVKEMLAAMLSRVGATAATRGNLNNDIGVPLTLLDWAPETRHAVVEMGANHVGEIAQLTELVAPDIGLVTMAGRAHVGEFGSVERIIQAKGELYRHCPAGCRAVVNLDSSGADQWLADVPAADTFTFDQSLADRATWLGTYRADRHELSIRERGESLVEALAIPMPGAHNAANLLAAIAVARLVGLEIDEIRAGLGLFEPPSGRMSTVGLGNGSRIIDDSYNANPESMRAALAHLAGLSGLRVAVLGCMGELGDQAAVLHRDLGAEAAEAGLDQVLAVGPDAEAVREGYLAAGGLEAGMVTAPDSGTAATALIDWLMASESGPAATILLKGSRFMHIERVREALEREYGVAGSRTDSDKEEAGCCSG